ncbi:hypothetical protein SLE2022_003290 [Rubroshorea leprosula]
MCQKHQMTALTSLDASTIYKLKLSGIENRRFRQKAYVSKASGDTGPNSLIFFTYKSCLARRLPDCSTIVLSLLHDPSVISHNRILQSASVCFMILAAATNTRNKKINPIRGLP